MRKRSLLAGLALLAGPAFGSPWAEVGDNQLRADIELLAASGLLDSVTTHWPLPWTSIFPQLRDASLVGQPDEVQAAVARVLAQAEHQSRPGYHDSAEIDATNSAGVVHGFDSLGRGDGEAQAAMSYSSADFSGRLAVGTYTQSFTGAATKLNLDNSFAAAKIGETALVYGGWLTHWWGPGWIAAMSLSNNARPIPQVGIERLETSASSWPVLEWLGPWQGEFFIGMLDGPQKQKNVIYDGLRFTFHPASGLEVGVARTDEICGRGHPCSPLEYFQLQNSAGHADKFNDEGLIDLKYSRTVFGLPLQAYLQVMNEDSSPFTHSGTSHLFGMTAFVATSGNPLRLTAEFADAIATTDIFSFGDYIRNFSYTDYKYIDGMHYRGRTLGFSLDTDSKLLSLQAGWSDPSGRFYELTLHRASIAANMVSSAPVSFDIAEARVTLPFRGLKFDLAGRVEDDQPRPSRGFAAAFESRIRIGF